MECPNTCWDAGKASREKLAKQVNVYKEGVKIRRSEIEGAKKLRQQNDIKLVTLRSTEKKLSDQVQKLKGLSLPLISMLESRCLSVVDYVRVMLET